MDKLIKKPMDWYSWRHSAIFQSKLDNIPPEEAAKKFGHGLEYYEKVYARLSNDDVEHRLNQSFGDEVSQPEKNITDTACSICGMENKAEEKKCSRCQSFLSIEDAMEEDSSRTNELETLRKQMKEMQEEQLKFMENMSKRIDSKIA